MDKKEMEEIIVAGGLTQTQINKLKDDNDVREIFLITVEGKEGEDDKYFWLKKPDMAILSAMASKGDQDPMGAMQIYFNSCLLEGDPKYGNDVDIFPAIVEKMEGLIEKRNSTIKNF